MAACPQPWRDCATMILDEGMRPSEVFRLEWSHVSFVGRGFVRIVEGKSKASRRTLPLTPRVYQLLAERHDVAVNPTKGWIFPARRESATLPETLQRNSIAVPCVILESSRLSLM